MALRLWDRMEEDEKLGFLNSAVDSAFDDPDPYFREFFLEKLLWLKWRRTTVFQGESSSSSAN